MLSIHRTFTGLVESVGISTYVLSKSLVSGSKPIPVKPLSTYVEPSLRHTNALAYAGAVSCLEREAVHDTRAYLFFRADCDLSGHMVFRSGSLEFLNVPARYQRRSQSDI